MCASEKRSEYGKDSSLNEQHSTNVLNSVFDKLLFIPYSQIARLGTCENDLCLATIADNSKEKRTKSTPDMQKGGK